MSRDLVQYKKDLDESRAARAIAEAKSWWKSRDAREKEAGFAVWKYRMSGGLIVSLPLPFEGEALFLSFGFCGIERRWIKLKPNQHAYLKRVFSLGDIPGRRYVHRDACRVMIVFSPRLEAAQ